MKIAFGIKQRDNPTPAKAQKFVKISTVACATLIAFMSTNNAIPHPYDEVVNFIMGAYVAVGNAILPYIGVTDAPAKIPKEDVEVMDTDNK